MAFDDAQKAYIENTIQLAIANQAEQFGVVMVKGQTIQDEIVAYVKSHQAELEQNSTRVNDLVTSANNTAEEIKNSSGKIAEAERLVTQLNENIKAYADSQSTIITEQQSKVEQLNAQTAEALIGLNDKLSNAVSGAQQEVYK